MNKDNGRSINILLCIAGVLCCVGSGMISAPKGLLADESISLIQALPFPHMLLFYAAPLALMTLACILVILGKMDMLSLCSVFVAGVLSAVMDFQFGVRYQTFPGILFNMIGVILVAAGVALQVFATESGPAKLSRKAAKSRNPKEFRYERSRRPSYDDIYFDASELAHTVQLKRELGLDTDMTEEDKYLALEAAEEEAAADAAAAQLQQEAEIEAMLRALINESAEPEATGTAEEPVELPETPDTIAPDRSTADSDAEIEEILEEMMAEAGTKELDDNNGASAVAMANMAAALETPNQTMTDFYAGIEDIFLDQDN